MTDTDKDTVELLQRLRRELKQQPHRVWLALQALTGRGISTPLATRMIVALADTQDAPEHEAHHARADRRHAGERGS